MNKIYKLLIIFLVLVTFLLEIASISAANGNAADSLDVTRIREQVESLKEQNLELSESVLGFASYNTISSRAAELGYLSNREFVSLYDPLEVAIGR
ncbi:MAG: hypothetical protein A3C27_03905 [Candidatus Levybacteria bacterium RIFCSPHIGHO2_02_FULL_39_36]|nr:MAG: hypothetical protein UT20_C0017G0016 [Candidatus Levybacteria bacterium GW2011_GWA1_39_11]KKR50090.1 MAG: hypothetical protein UT85_C0006G0019 [Candidatus Levybacteria bacterium GW2011_GWA2_40_16]OGH15427.1 MAG: hypothetical protein A2689_01240 [Candidatus Levybacteria bacterium RIFCSPHIGHO2_01_FULL_38_96]OGH26021.1 MAG: hypothetical protein A3E68_03220 [Candidatus Levybacteria bacterium RIFCSPHIGHO2_12_FULL_39_39]OGH28863.1 MAG: hypothetical protein A3C27_03905 [Candidatus Levybacteria